MQELPYLFVDSLWKRESSSKNWLMRSTVPVRTVGWGAVCVAVKVAIDDVAGLAVPAASLKVLVRVQCTTGPDLLTFFVDLFWLCL